MIAIPLSIYFVFQIYVLVLILRSDRRRISKLGLLILHFTIPVYGIFYVFFKPAVKNIIKKSPEAANSALIVTGVLAKGSVGTAKWLMKK